MKFIAIIPARYASTRFPGKPLAMLGGKPVIRRVYEQVEGVLDDAVVATDDERIYDAVLAFGGRAEMTSPDHKSGTDRCWEAYLKQGKTYDVVVNVQGDEPLIDPKLVDQTAAVLVENGAPMATAAHEIHDFDEFMNPNVVKVVLCRQGRALYFSRAPIAYPRDSMRAGERTLPQADAPLRHIGIYAYRAGFLHDFVSWGPCWLENTERLEQLRALWHGVRIHVADVLEAPPAGVDTVEDLERVRRLLEA